MCVKEPKEWCILELPNEVIIDVLGHLDWQDLCNVAGVCTRLATLAQKVFTSKWKQFEMICSDVEITEQCLRHFGAEIITLRIMPSRALGMHEFASILYYLSQYCRESLINLEIHSFIFDWNDRLIEEVQPLFSRLKTIILKDCVMYAGWLLICSELIEMILIRSKIFAKAEDDSPHQPSMLLTTKIDELEYMYNRGAVYRRDLVPDQKYERKTMVKRFETVERHRNAPITHMEIISNIFEFCADDRISKFRNLKALKIYIPVAYESSSLITAVTELHDLHELAIRCFVCNFSQEYLLKLIGNAPHLHHLIIAFEGVMALKFNSDTYRSILNIIDQRSNNHKLLHISFFCKDSMSTHADIDNNFLMHPSLVVMKHLVP